MAKGEKVKKILALGSNQPSDVGDSAQTLSNAIEVLSERLGITPHISRFFSTPAFPEGSGPDFVNAVVVLESGITPGELLGICHSLEQDAHRVRAQRWAARTLDIDVIACDDAVLPDTRVHAYWRDLPLSAQLTETPTKLIVPHPRMQDRAFVLVPMMDVAPAWRHPILGLTTTQMCAALPQSEIDAVKPLET